MVHAAGKLVVKMGVAEHVQAVAASLVRLVVVALLVVAVLDTLDRLAAHLVVAQDTQDILVAWDTQLVVAQDTLVASHLVVDLGSSLDSQTALVVEVVSEVGVAQGAARLQGRSSATGVVGLAISLPTAQILLQPMW